MTTLAEDPIQDPIHKKLRAEFCSLTGYGPSDILSLNFETGIFLTRGGGKYRLNNHTIQRLAGPSADPTERI